MSLYSSFFDIYSFVNHLFIVGVTASYILNAIWMYMIISKRQSKKRKDKKDKKDRKDGRKDCVSEMEEGKKDI